MGTISSGVGLISGIDTGKIVDQLIAIEAQPQNDLKTQVQVLNSQKTAFLDIGARLIALKSSSTSIGDATLFKTTTATSSNTDVLTATSSKSAPLGTYSFTPRQLVTSQSLITRGFADTETSPVSAAGGTLTVESAAARLDREVNLSELNGGAGIQRGLIRITDRSGASAQIDLTAAVTINDVLDAINNSSGINVTASLEGDHLKLADNTGAAASNLTVVNVGSTTTATSLGIAGSTATTSITGTQLNAITATTSLASLNDGTGVRIKGTGQDDLTFTTQDGATFNVSLFGAQTVGDVLTKINTASGGSVTAAIGTGGTGLQLTDNTVGGSTFGVIAAVATGSSAGADLGIVGPASAAGVISGSRIVSSLGSKLLKNISGGAGVTAGHISVNGTDVDLTGATSISDVIGTINASAAGVTASLNSAGNGLNITRNTAGALTIADVSGDVAAKFGLAQTSATGTIAGTNAQYRWINENTRFDQLNGGKGVAAGTFTITDSTGATSIVDLSNSAGFTLQKVIDLINTRPTAIKASINSTGDGLLLTDTGGGAATMKITEGATTTAGDLGLLATPVGTTVNGSYEKHVTIGATDTLSTIVTNINNAGAGVTASVINDGSGVTPFRLAFSSNNTGVAGRVSVDDGGMGLQTTSLVKGNDAVVLFGSTDPAKALLLTSSTNTLTNTISGVTISLLGTSTTPVDLTITRDTGGIKDAIKQFVSDYNAVLDGVDKYDTYDSSTNKKGLLLGDPTVSIIKNRMLNMVNTKVAGVSGSFSFLTQIGLTIGQGARLTLDDTRLSSALNTDPTGVASLFTATTTVAPTDNVGLPPGVTIPSSSTTKSVGFGKLMLDLVSALNDSTNGTLTLATNGIDAKVKLDNTRIDEIGTRLDAKRALLESQFAAMETALAQIQQQQGAISQLSTLASTKSG